MFTFELSNLCQDPLLSAMLSFMQSMRPKKISILFPMTTVVFPTSLGISSLFLCFHTPYVVVCPKIFLPILLHREDIPCTSIYHTSIFLNIIIWASQNTETYLPHCCWWIGFSVQHIFVFTFLFFC